MNNYSAINGASKKTNTSYKMINCNLIKSERQKARDRMAAWNDQLLVGYAPLYKWDGIAYTLIGDL